MVNKYCAGEEKTFHDFLSAGHYTKGVRHYLDAFDLMQIYMFEDFQRDPTGIVRSIYELIGVNDTMFVPSNINEIYNASGSLNSVLSRFIYDFLFDDNAIKKYLKSIISLRLRLRIKAEVTTKIINKVEMPIDVREFLENHYVNSMNSLHDLLPDPAQKAVVDKWLL